MHGDRVEDCRRNLVVRWWCPYLIVERLERVKPLSEPLRLVTDAVLHHLTAGAYHILHLRLHLGQTLVQPLSADRRGYGVSWTQTVWVYEKYQIIKRIWYSWKDILAFPSHFSPPISIIFKCFNKNHAELVAVESWPWMSVGWR